MTLLVALYASVAWAAPAVKDIRISSGPDGTRVVFDLTETVGQKLFTLDKPNRVVLDLRGAQLNLLEGLPKADGVIKKTRASKRDNGDLRVVFEVSGAVKARAFAVAPIDDLGPRLVVDLFAPGVTPKQSSLSVAAKPTAPAPATSKSRPSATQMVATETSVSVPSAATTVSASVAPVSAESKPTLQPEPPVSASASGRDLVIAIDAGHGGQDPGAIGRRGTQEKQVTLAIARKLKEKIDAEPGMRAVLTRDGDYFIPLRDRMTRARNQKADMFISVHADSVNDRSVTGSSVYVLSSRGASSEAARWLAERENAADLAGGVSLDDKNDLLASVLLDVYQGATMSASAEAAGQVLRGLDRIGNVHRVGVQQAGFLVLKSPDVPSMLVETAFISNAAEEAKLADALHQDRLAGAIMSGVRDYFYNNAPPGTRLAQIKAYRQAAR